MSELDRITKQFKTFVVKKALKSYAIIQTKQMKALAPKLQGALKPAISNRIKTYRQSSVTVAVIGAKKDFHRPYKKVSRVNQKLATGFRGRGTGPFNGLFHKKRKQRQYNYVVPANYFPLVNQGTRYFKGRFFRDRSFNKQQFDYIFNAVSAAGLERLHGRK